jgi:hypothetical protein
MICTALEDVAYFFAYGIFWLESAEEGRLVLRPMIHTRLPGLLAGLRVWRICTAFDDEVLARERRGGPPCPPPDDSRGCLVCRGA